MTMLVCALATLAVATALAWPLLGTDAGVSVVAEGDSSELWQREKSVALVAIKEADFDRATGKLSDDDYASLRSDYEERALHAISELDHLEGGRKTKAAGGAAATEASGKAVFCTSCGTRFGADHAFCASCGKPRA